ncbi:hypothetical protein Ddc_17855 [Ditylenchus destructor]|nr:hypothetical protein Ddc_17855 [Ditylenchus destructor]
MSNHSQFIPSLKETTCMTLQSISFFPIMYTVEYLRQEHHYAITGMSFCPGSVLKSRKCLEWIWPCELAIFDNPLPPFSITLSHSERITTQTLSFHPTPNITGHSARSGTVPLRGQPGHH